MIHYDIIAHGEHDAFYKQIFNMCIKYLIQHLIQLGISQRELVLNVCIKFVPSIGAGLNIWYRHKIWYQLLDW